MNAFSFFGYAILLAISPVLAIVASRWARGAWHAVKALRVLSMERRTGESLYNTAEALAGDAHEWRGMASPSVGCMGDEVDDNEETGLAAAVKRIHANDRQKIVAFDARKGIVSITNPQPMPQNSDGPALWPLIISELGASETDRLVAVDMQQRHEFGVAKYGVPLVASNGRDHLADAYQEALDGVVYLRAAFDSQAEETHQDHELSRSGCIGALPNLGRSKLHQAYVDTIDLAKEIRGMIRERDGR